MKFIVKNGTAYKLKSRFFKKLNFGRVFNLYFSGYFNLRFYITTRLIEGYAPSEGMAFWRGMVYADGMVFKNIMEIFV
jgi:hypothetical protein